ncbi:hypothetical protein M3221_18335 [Domibacillus indicus]|uniref:hypothetical protein n=1 Tax=Domibacillus indicus TaxID=1437523 RepID=UPI002041DC53|nr:hypothetical protein [Domibacillus indicus]MCM3790339.1 hypothetical protein [Domibacillus indicus]
MFTKTRTEINIITIPIDKIKPLYNPKVTGTFSKRMHRSLDYLNTFDLLLPVEKHPQKDEYYLVGSYDRYSFIKEMGFKKAPCIIEDFTDKNSEYLKILKRLDNKGDSNKANKQYILNKLLLSNVPSIEILEKTGFTNQDFTNYQYKPTVPAEYKNDYTTEETLNWIEGLKLENSVKDFLYERAGLNNAERLTGEKRKFLQHFFKNAQRFQELSAFQQIEILAAALNFNNVAMLYLQGKIDEHLE